MDIIQTVEQAKTKFRQAIERYQEELKKIRTGRAHPGMLEGVMVEAYGTQIPLLQAGSITVPEAQLLQIAPFDPNNIQAIAAAIRDDKSLGMNPSDDGHVIRIPIPPLNEERRLEYIKMLHGKMEDCMISLRNVRHDFMEDAEKAKKDREIGEDDAKRLHKQIDDLMNNARNEAEELTRAKEKEMLTV